MEADYRQLGFCRHYRGESVRGAPDRPGGSAGFNAEVAQSSMARGQSELGRLLPYRWIPQRLRGILFPPGTQ